MKSLAELEAIKNRIKNQVEVRKDTDEDTVRIVVGMATCGIAAGARPVLSALVDEVGPCDGCADGLHRYVPFRAHC